MERLTVKISPKSFIHSTNLPWLDGLQLRICSLTLTEEIVVGTGECFPESEWSSGLEVNHVRGDQSDIDERERIQVGQLGGQTTGITLAASPRESF